MSLCHGTRGNLSGGSCPAWQVFSLWEQLTRSDKTTIKNSCSSGCAADSSSSGTCQDVTWTPCSLWHIYPPSSWCKRQVPAPTPHRCTMEAASCQQPGKQWQNREMSLCIPCSKPCSISFPQGQPFSTAQFSDGVKETRPCGLGWCADSVAATRASPTARGVISEGKFCKRDNPYFQMVTLCSVPLGLHLQALNTLSCSW